MRAFLIPAGLLSAALHTVQPSLSLFLSQVPIIPIVFSSYSNFYLRKEKEFKSGNAHYKQMFWRNKRPFVWIVQQKMKILSFTLLHGVLNLYAYEKIVKLTTHMTCVLYSKFSKNSVWGSNWTFSCCYLLFCELLFDELFLVMRCETFLLVLELVSATWLKKKIIMTFYLLILYFFPHSTEFMLQICLFF